MIVAAFRDPDGLRKALAGLDRAKVGAVETYTPAPLEGADTWSPLPLVILAAGLLGAAASFRLQVYSSVRAYPFIVGNRPYFAWVSFVPTVFENAALLAIAAGFVGFFAINRMPRLYEPVDEAAVMRRASGDRWCVAVLSGDRAVLDRARATLQALDAAEIEEVPA